MVTWEKTTPTIVIKPPRRPKKITGTRFASILGLNPWVTPFEVWCEITRTYEKPFVENKYTRAGKAIEPIVLKYLNDIWYAGNVVAATDIYGPEPYKTARGDFFQDEPIFGGMWDALLTGDSGETVAVIEVKTTGRIDKWAGGAPDYLALQGAEYAYLLGVDRVIMVVAVLEESDYIAPEKFQPNAGNVIIDDFIIEERYPGFAETVKIAEEWWDKYVLTGTSPYYDTRDDAEILTALKTTTIDTTGDLSAMLREAGQLHLELKAHEQSVAGKISRLKKLEEHIKTTLIDGLGENDTKAVAETGTVVYYELSSGQRESIDKDALEADGLLAKYTISTPSFTLRTKIRKDGK